MMANTPNIRFKGFSDDWEQRKLETTLCSLQNNTLSRAELTYEEGTIKNVHYGDILVKYGEVIDVKNEQIPNIIDNTIAEKYKTSFLQNGDVIFADTAEDRTVGKCTEISGLTDERVLSGLHTIPYRPQLKFAKGYLGYYLNSNAFRQQLISLMQGIKVTSISKSAMQTTDIIYPQSVGEQAKIGNYFIQLDDLITLQQRKCDEVKQLKKIMLQKMFPKSGELIPEVRFVGFTGNWERRKFSNIVTEKLTNGIMNQQSEESTDTRHINVINMYSSDKIHTDDLTYSSCDEKAVKKCNVEVGDIFLTRSSLKPEGIAESNVLLDSGRFVFDDHLIRMKIDKENYDSVFTKILLSTEPVKKQFMAKSKQNAFTTIGQEDVASSDGLFPNLYEQRRIGQYFIQLDNFITLLQCKCDDLKEVKRFMLQNMFFRKES